MSVMTPTREQTRPAWADSIAGISEKNRGPSYAAFAVLYGTYVLFPILAGLGQLFHTIANWEAYLSPVLRGVLDGRLAAFMTATGLIELALGFYVSGNPRYGGWAVAGWLWAGALNLLYAGGHNGLVICFVALSAGAIALSLLALEFDGRD